MKFIKIRDIFVCVFPQEYGVESWAIMLDIVRNNKFDDAKYIALDFSNVNQILDMGMESYILRDEFKDKGGFDVFFIGVPDLMMYLFDLVNEGEKIDRIRSFQSLDELLSEF